MCKKLTPATAASILVYLWFSEQLR